MENGEFGTTMLDEGKSKDINLLSPGAHNSMPVKTLVSLKSKLTLTDINGDGRGSRPLVLTRTPSIQNKMVDHSIPPPNPSSTSNSQKILGQMKSSTTCVWPHSLQGPDVKGSNLLSDK
jgi:hypothetical protein